MLDDCPSRRPAAVGAAPAAPAPAPRRIDSAALIGPGRELLIDHQQQVYRLRVTSQGKLILTK